MLRVIVLGYGPMGLGLARGVMSCAESQLVGVFPWSHLPRKRVGVVEVCENEFQTFLKEKNIERFRADSVNSYRFMDYLKRQKPDVILVGSWGEVFKPHVLNISGVRFINCHPSLLPYHRGPNPYIAAILAGDTQSGVTFHEMDEKIDTGPILLQQSVTIADDETGISLRAKCATLAEQSVPKLLQAIASNNLKPQVQTETGSYDRISPELGRIDWQESSEKIERRIRALYPWLPVYGTIGRQVIGFRSGRQVSLDKPTDRPGVILSSSRQGVVVSTIEPGSAILLAEPFLYDYPSWLGRLFTGGLLKPGQSFKI